MPQTGLQTLPVHVNGVATPAQEPLWGKWWRFVWTEREVECLVTGGDDTKPIKLVSIGAEMIDSASHKLPAELPACTCTFSFI